MAEDMERIARAIISQALSDAGLGMPRGERVMVNSLDRDEARSFLLAESGAWKQARDTWCLLADLDSETLRRRTAEVLSGARPLFAPKPPPKAPRVTRGPGPSEMRKRAAPMPGTKLSSILYYLKRPEGLSVDELVRLGWTRQAAQTGIYEMRLYGIVPTRGPDGRYRVSQAA
jgi:hypothetical protein